VTDDSDLRARLARHDPARRADAAARLHAVTEPELRERIVRTIEETTTTPVPRARPGRRLAFALGGVAVAVAAVTAATAFRGGDAPDDAGTTLALRAPRSDTMASCVAFDVAVLREMPVAFAGTVASVGDGTVTLDVDRWFAGGDADRVTVANPDAANVSIDGVEFTTGTRYLVTATDGTVNSCGFTAPATPDLERSFEQAFS